MQAAKPLIIITTPWRKYSNYFDKNCWDIWGLAPLLKYTLLIYFLLFFPPLFGIVKFENSYDTVVLIVFLASVAIWAFYLPILGLILFKRATEKTIEIGSKTINYLSRDPMLVPEEVKKEPNSFLLFIRALQYWWFVYSTKIIYKHRKTLTELSTIYPISLLFQNKMWHTRNQKLWKTLRKIEAVAGKAKMPIDIDEINLDDKYNFVAHFSKKNSFPVKRLEDALQDHFGAIYVRNLGKGQIQINTTIGEVF